MRLDDPTLDTDFEQALRPITPIVNDPSWGGATWIGQIDYSDLVGPPMRLVGGEGFHQARLLIWKRNQPVGFVEVPVHNGLIDRAAVREHATELPDLPPLHTSDEQPPISVVICTRDRPDHLKNVLDSLRGLDYLRFEVIVVDNNPASDLTPPVVESYLGPPVRLVQAVGQGLSIARNVGLQNARHNIVAFTDDDVVLDKCWLTNIANGFARDDRVACVCGMVPTSELLTPAQGYFDRRASWAERWIPAVYDLRGRAADDGLFPLRVSEFGTGANFAVRKDVVTTLGGFDEALGAGSPAGSGEDVDVFVRTLLAGYLLVREPSAVVWHSHRRTAGELESQMYNYGVGLSAWLFKLLLHPRTFAMVVRRLFTGIRHLRRVTVVECDSATDVEPALRDVKRRELAGVTRGPIKLVQGRLVGRRAAPMKASARGRTIGFRRGRLWGDTDNTVVSGRLAATAVGLALIGSVGAVDSLPTVVRAIAVGAFMLGGPGCLISSFYTHLPRYALMALTPVVGLALCILAVTGALMAGIYSPAAVLLVLTLATATAGIRRCAYLISPKRLPA